MSESTQHADVSKEIVSANVDGENFKPYVTAGEDPKQFTFRAVLIGIIIGVSFGAANAYLGLKAGMTVSASIPAAVLGVAALRLLGKGNILEANMIQTIGSSGEAIAAGIIFTIPTFFLWGMDPGQFKIFIIALFGGVMGIIFMIPTRYYLMVKEHGKLPFPEGVACAEVLIADQEKGGKAAFLLKGVGLGALYQILSNPSTFGLWKGNIVTELSRGIKTTFGIDLVPELLGVGYIIGPRITTIQFSGALIASFMIIPLIAVFGVNDPQIANMTASEIRGQFVRMIGIGVIAAGGIITLFRAIPAMIHSLKKGMQGLIGTRRTSPDIRTEHDLSPLFILGSSIAIIALLMILPDSIISLNFAGALCLVVATFIFVLISARLTGIVGSSSTPGSGMTIATLLLTAGVFIALGLTEDVSAAKIIILTVGAVSCVATASASDIAQDLKTGFLIGATPWKQQVGELVGAVIPAFALSFVIYLFRKDIMSGALEAPQANLMAMIIEAVLTHKVQWALVFIGGVLACVAEILGVSALALALGVYLPFWVTAPIMVGGLMNWIVRKVSKETVLAERQERGVLYSCGLVAGAALVGVLIAALVGASDISAGVKNFLTAIQGIGHGGLGDVWSGALYGLLALSIIYVAIGRKTRSG